MENLMPGEYLFGWLDDTLIPKLGGSVANLIVLISPVMGAAVILSFVLWAFRYIKEQMPLTDLLWRHFVLMAVCFFGLNASYYVSDIIPMVNSIPQDIAGAFSDSSSQASAGTIVDNMITHDADLIKKIWTETRTITWSGIKVDNIFNAARATFLISGLGGIYIALSFFLIFISTLMVNVILSIGPIFILCAFFAPTRNYFTLWVNQLVNYMLLSILFAVIFAVQHTLVSDIVQIDPDTGGVNDLAAAQLAVIYIVCLGTILIIPVLASSLSGGMGLNGVIGGTANTISMLGGKAVMAGMKQPKPPSNLGKNNIKPG